MESINNTTLDDVNKAVLESFSKHLRDFFMHLSVCVGNTQLYDDEASIIEDMCLYMVKICIYPRNVSSKYLSEAINSLKKTKMIDDFKNLIRSHRDIIKSDLYKVKHIDVDLYNQIIFKWNNDLNTII